MLKNSDPELITYLSPTDMIESSNPEIITYANKVKGKLTDPLEIAKSLYYEVRDGIIYDPYTPFWLPFHYKATYVLRQGRGFCIPKAALLCTLSRAVGIPCRLGFATVRNHLATKALLERLGTDLFVYHGFVEFWLKDKWVKATPAFNKELCERFNVPPLEFDGLHDSIFQMFNRNNQTFMEYIEFHGTYADVPLNEIVAAFENTYGKERVEGWIRDFESQEKTHPPISSPCPQFLCS